MSKPDPRLIEIWYAKLRKKGFKDIETSNGLYLKTWSLSRSTNGGTTQSRIEKEGRELYFRLAKHVGRKTRFDNNLHRRIWALHSEGKTAIKIATKLQCSYSTVITVIRNMRKKFVR